MRSRVTSMLACGACMLLMAAPGIATAKPGGAKPPKPPKPAKPAVDGELAAKARAAAEARIGTSGTLATFSCKPSGYKKVTCRFAGTWTGATESSAAAPAGTTFKGHVQAETKCKKQACAVRTRVHLVVKEPDMDEDEATSPTTVAPAPAPVSATT